MTDSNDSDGVSSVTIDLAPSEAMLLTQILNHFEVEFRGSDDMGPLVAGSTVITRKLYRQMLDPEFRTSVEDEAEAAIDAVTEFSATNISGETNTAFQ